MKYHIVGVLFVMCFISSCTYDMKKCELYIRNSLTEEDYRGVVINKYILRGRVPYIMLPDSNKYEIYHLSMALYKYIDIGDSIIKDSGTLKYILVKKDTALIFYPYCRDVEIKDVD